MTFIITAGCIQIINNSRRENGLVCLVLIACTVERCEVACAQENAENNARRYLIPVHYVDVSVIYL